MRVLLDTPAILWWLHDASRLSQRVQSLVREPENQLVWSAASTWEIAIKSSRGRLRITLPLRELVTRATAEQGFAMLPIQHLHAIQAAELQVHEYEVENLW